MGKRKTAVLGTILTLVLALHLPAATYSENFIGLGTEFDMLYDPTGAVPEEAELVLHSINLAFTYGPEVTAPFRFRTGIGYFPRRPFQLFVGTEIPLFERLNASRAKFFGLYLIGDAALTVQDTVGGHFEASLSLLVPFSATGGLSLGGGMASDGRVLLKATFMSGVYPMVLRPAGGR